MLKEHGERLTKAESTITLLKALG